MSIWTRNRTKTNNKTTTASNRGRLKRSRPRKVDEIVDIAAVDNFDGALTESIRARWTYWSEIGHLAPELVAPEINPIYKNVPAWPANRLAFLTVERDQSTMLITDGLSDPFDTANQTTQGFGVEYFMETVERPLTETARTYCVETLMTIAFNTVTRGGVEDLLDEHGVFSMEIPESDLPNTHLTKDGNACVLLGGPLPDFDPLSIGGPLGDIEIVPMVLLTGKEAEHIRRHGANGRAEIAQNLLEAGIGHRTVIGRPSII